jgi:anti-sigma-K factor RskA
MTELFDPDDNILAAEYVLQLLGIEERQAFSTRLTEEEELRKLVWNWEIRFAPLTDKIPEISPPARIRDKILERIVSETKHPPLVRRWMLGLIGLVGATAVALFVLTTSLRDTTDLEPEFLAELTSENGGVIITAGVIPQTHEIIIDRLAGSPDADRDWELWLIAEGTSAPVSLGLLAKEGTTRIRVPDEIATGVRTGTIAISDEPLGGSPTGLPTGQILVAGTFEDI